MVRPERFELPTYCSGGNRSIQLSYGRILPKYTSIDAPACPPNPAHRRHGMGSVPSEAILFLRRLCSNTRYALTL